ncbi:hypothetical protein D5086_009473 [Populus alba]|uniref:Uncharacterized protein n=1 Tax=Populus alba TaxID=43335 RepID=A0ACC4CJ15_POPAL
MSSSYPILFKAMSSQQFTLPSSLHLKASPSPSSTPRPSITKPPMLSPVVNQTSSPRSENQALIFVGQIVKSDDSIRCLIADTFFGWPSKIAKKFGLLYVSFWTEPALVFTLYYHMDLLMINGHFACQDCREDTIDYIPGVKAIEPKDMASYLQETDTTSVYHQLIFEAFNDARNADFLLCNTVQELEVETLSALQAKMPCYAIGPIFPNGFTKSFVATSLWSESDCTQWLDKKPHGSVFSDDADPLPDGFEEEVADRAMIIPWCNQFTNRKLVVDDWKIGFNLSDGRFVTKEEVSNNVKRLMSGKSEDGFRNTIKEMKKTLENALSCNGSSEKNMARFVKDLKTKISEKMKPVDRSACTGG